METDRLRQFRTLVETCNMRKAADLLHISNGGLSRSIKMLEAQLGIKLIVPRGRGIAITDAGIEIYRKSEALLHSVDALSRPKEIAASLPTVRIGSFEVFSTYFLAYLMKNYLPDYMLLLREYGPGSLESCVLENTIDFGITYVPVPHVDLEFVDITEIDLGVFGLSGIFKGVDLVKLPFVVPSQAIVDSPSGLKGLDGWPEHGCTRNIRFRVELMESALALCRAGLCVGFFPQFVIDLHNRSMRKEFHLHHISMHADFKTVKRSVYMIKKLSRPEDFMMRQIAKAIRTMCRASHGVSESACTNSHW